jgi:hypothetical protein
MKVATFLLGLLVLVGAATRADADTYKFWIKAFIPNSHPTNPGYIVPDPSGGTMIQDPVFTGSCYTTDNRDFTSDASASARMTSQLVLSVDSSGLTNGSGDETEQTGQTNRVKCSDGTSDGCSDHADTSGMKFSNVKYDAFNNGTLYFSVDASAANPCFPIQIPGHVNFAPNIHYKGQFTIGVQTNVVSYSIEIGGFPAFEIYVQKNSQSPVTVLQQPPANGSTVFDIPSSRPTLEGCVSVDPGAPSCGRH